MFSIQEETMYEFAIGVSAALYFILGFGVVRCSQFYDQRPPDLAVFVLWPLALIVVAIIGVKDE